MDGVGLILIILFILLILAGIGLAIWYFVYHKNKTPAAPTGPTGPPGPTGLTGATIPNNISILTSVNPQLGLTRGPTGAAIVFNTSSPTGPTGSTTPNVCSVYSWLYSGGTGTIGPSPTGPTGTARIVTGVGSNLQYGGSANEFLQANFSSSGSVVTVGSIGPTWLFVPNTVNSFGKWCLNIANILLCLHYNTNNINQQLTIREFRIGRDENDQGFNFSTISKIVSPACITG